jgi:hypothetical protein
MCILESFHSSFNNSGLEFCSIAEFKNLQIINYLLNDDCENCGQTSSKREHLKNHNEIPHQRHLNKASSCWRKYLHLRSNKEVIIKLSYPHCFFSYSVLNFLINENSSKNSFSPTTSFTLSGMIIQNWVYPTGVVIQYLTNQFTKPHFEMYIIVRSQEVTLHYDNRYLRMLK